MLLNECPTNGWNDKPVVCYFQICSIENWIFYLIIFDIDFYYQNKNKRRNEKKEKKEKMVRMSL